MIDALDAMTAVAKQLPEDGITFREFVTRAARLRGDSDEVIEAAFTSGNRTAEKPTTL